MCIAILNQTGVLSLKTFKRCWQSNPDGAGFCYFDGDKVQIVKEMKSVKLLHKQYTEVRAKFPDVDIAIHFRVSTHGRVNSTNCHPFRVSKNTAFIHNGIIQGVGTSPDFSDTYLFNEGIVKKLPSNFVHNGAILELLATFIGYSKLVIISGNQSAIVNEDLGHWDGGNWFSNKSYLAPENTRPVSAPYSFGGRYGWEAPSDYFTDEWDDKSKAVVSSYGSASKCDCCFSDSPAHYVPEWSINMCAECVEHFAEDLGRAAG